MKAKPKNLCDLCNNLIIVEEGEITTCKLNLHKDYKPITKCKSFLNKNDKGAKPK